MNSQRIDFQGSQGAAISARLDLPEGTPRAFALFAHCFTCSKDFQASKRIASGLASQGFAVLRFDFTGLGSSGGDFSSTNFSSNVEDLVLAADELRNRFSAPALLVGHSLGGAAVLAAASRIPETRAVVTIGAPSDAAHVVNSFAADLDRIETEGKATVSLAGRAFTIRKQFLDDVESVSLREQISSMRKPLLILHSPIDQTVGIENAQSIFQAARHPKSFISLDKADHLLSDPADASYVAVTIASWADRYLEQQPVSKDSDKHTGVMVSETGESWFQNAVVAGRHHLLADEPVSYGGTDTGPSPYDFLSIALGACTNMTLRLYAERKDLHLPPVSVIVDHEKVHAADCESCSEQRKSEGGKIDRFRRRISIAGEVEPEVWAKLLEIADKCPVHRTLHGTNEIVTEIVPGTPDITES